LEAGFIPGEDRGGEGGSKVHLLNVRASLPSEWPEDDDPALQGALRVGQRSALTGNCNFKSIKT